MAGNPTRSLMDICSVELAGCSACCGSGSDKLDWHSYIPVYERELAGIRHTAENVLEIGVQGGGSVALWERYFSKANVFGIDIIDSRFMTQRARQLVGPRCKLLWNTDAYSERTIQTLAHHVPSGFDLIVDDGPHTLESQVYCAREYPAILKPGGLLIIEDINGMEYAQTILSSLPSSVNGKILDLRAQKNRFDDIMVVAQKPRE